MASHVFVCYHTGHTVKRNSQRKQQTHVCGSPKWAVQSFSQLLCSYIQCDFYHTEQDLPHTDIQD